ncbi:MAG TPA: 2OG-Fe dioxygenase family protein, partial [Burkholderiaceae bacterium]|nr:2OG-Fe dioxygenase family protein [Burkholderiaceae bacterium]
MSAPRFAPPVTPPAQVDAALRERGQAVLDAAGLHALIGVAPGAFDAWRGFWDHLPPDAHLRDGGRYRQRRHGAFVVEGGRVSQAPHRAHWQPVEYNALHGGIERWFEPIEPALVADPLWTRLLAMLAERASALRGARTW